MGRLYYHVTPKKNLRGILSKGLKPRGGVGFYPEAEYKDRIYLFGDEADAHNFIEEASLYLDGPTRLVLLSVLVPSSIKVYKDPDMPSIREEGFYITEAVPPTNLSVVYSGWAGGEQ